MTQPDHRQSKGLPLVDLALIVLVALLSCVIGYYLGTGGISVKQRLEALTGATTAGQPMLPALSYSEPVPPQDGLYLVNRDKTLTPIPVVLDDTRMDLSTLPAAPEGQPTLAIRGDDLALGDLKLTGYIAGIGVDLTFSQSGATIKTVFAGSPTQAAGLRAGDMILSLNGAPVKQPTFYTPGQNDLLGPMQATVQLEVVAGTTTRTVTLPRTYRGSVSSTVSALMNTTVPFTVEAKGNYVLLCVTRDLAPGVYGLQFQRTERSMPGELVHVGPTRTPTPTPTPASPRKWVFVVE